MNIALIGFRGTGKTTIGRELAKKLKMRFVDLDDEIVARAGKPIPTIFSEIGEAGFRGLEKKCVAEFSAFDNQCIACGGGAVLFAGNVDNLRRNSRIVLLEADERTIFERIKNDKNRPALTGLGGIEEVRHLLEERKSFYENAADIRVDTSKNTVKKCAVEIVEKLRRGGFA